MRSYRTTIEDNKYTDRLSHVISITNDEERLYLKIDFMSGRFIIEKNFQNNSIGLEELDQISKNLDTEEKVCEYLGIGEIKDGK